MRLNLLFIPLFFGSLISINACQQSADAKETLETQEKSNKDLANTETVDTVKTPVSIQSGVLTGDIILQTSQSSQSKAIQLATNSEFSHVGVVFLSKTDTMVLEAIQPVKFTKYRDFINRGENSAYTLMRLKDRSPITLEKQSQLHIVGSQYVGMDYDWLFDWSDNKLYCSELVYKLYKTVLGIELCDPRPLKDYSLNAELVRQKLAERYGKTLPLDELMVSPEDIYRSNKLMQVED